MAKPRKNPNTAEQQARYEKHRDDMRQRQADSSRQARDIGPLPPVADPDRRAAAEGSLRAFAECYFGDRFHIAWSPDHLTIIAKLEQVICGGGQLAWAQPRGSGKTSLVEVAAMWATFTGRRRFVVPIGASADAAENMVASIRAEIETNDILAEDWPEVCYPVRRLEGLATRSPGQTLDGERTQIGLAAKELVLPSVANAASSGAIIRAAGITGSLRGMKHGILRPDLVLLDDVQDDEVAHSPAQVQKRESIINSTVMGLAGPRSKISAVMLATVIAPQDLADRFLDQTKYPSWQGQTFKLMYAMPTDAKLWEQYRELRDEGLRTGEGTAEATEFYRQHQAEMDEGAEPAWPERMNDDEISATQNAMNIRFDRGEAAFAAEYQNAPLDLQQASELVTAEDLEAKITGVPHRRVPQTCHTVTAFIDVQQKLLWHGVCAFGDGFGGQILDVGSFPDQQRNYYTLVDAQKTLARAKPGAGIEGQIYSGLEKLVGDLLGRTWIREDGAELKIGRLMIDAGWQTEVVRQFCRESEHRALLLPSFGRGISADRKPISQYQKKPGMRLGQEWFIQPGNNKQRHLIYDSNWWTSFVHHRLAQAHGDKGSLGLYKAKPQHHRMLIEHLTAEYPVPTSGGGRQVDIWKLRPGRDNHLLDCIVGCAIAASEQGIQAIGHAVAPAQPKRRRRRRVEATF